MKIIILGAGQVGASVAESLVSEANEINVVDTDAPRLRQLQDRFDLRTVVGNAALPSVLRQAGAEDTDLLIAVTQSDQTNLCACRTAATLFKIPTKIARLRSPDYTRHPELLDERNFCVDFSICPEQIVTDYLLKLIEFPEALQVLEFAEGLVSLAARSADHARGRHPDRGRRRGLLSRRHPRHPAGDDRAAPARSAHAPDHDRRRRQHRRASGGRGADALSGQADREQRGARQGARLGPGQDAGPQWRRDRRGTARRREH